MLAEGEIIKLALNDERGPIRAIQHALSSEHDLRLESK